MINNMRRRTGAAFAIALASAITLPSLAVADVVTNDVTSTAGGRVVTVSAGSSALVAYSVSPNDNKVDSQNGCNTSDGTPLRIGTVLPAGITSGLATADSCGDSVASLTFSVSASVHPGDYTITHVLSDAGGGTYSNDSDFTLRVTAPTTSPQPTDTSAPTTSVRAVFGSTAYTSDTWTNETVTVTLSAEDNTGGSGVNEIRFTTDGSTPSKTSGSIYSEPLSFVSDGITAIKYASVDNAGNIEAVQTFVVKVDKTAPVVSPEDVDNTTWRNTALSQTFTAADGAGSGLANAADAKFALTVSDDSANANTPTTVSRTVMDNAGNSTTRSVSALIDTVAPTNVQFLGGPAAGAQYYYGAVPKAPTCTAEDALSGLASCEVSGHSSSTGDHTMTATATDHARNATTLTRSYSVLNWNTLGFHKPVDGNGVLNTVKGGSTVPLKFEVFAGVAPAGELTTTDAIGATLNYGKTNCTADVATDEVETLATGSTALRYDSTAGQFIYNWKTPTTAGCYRVTVTLKDGSTISADFRTR